MTIDAQYIADALIRTRGLTPDRIVKAKATALRQGVNWQDVVKRLPQEASE